MISILYVGTNPEINPVMDRLLKSRGDWQGTVLASAEAALALLGRTSFRIVLLGNGLSEGEERSLREAALQHPDTSVIAHYGGGSGLLENEIRAAIEGAIS